MRLEQPGLLLKLVVWMFFLVIGGHLLSGCGDRDRADSNPTQSPSETPDFLSGEDLIAEDPFSTARKLAWEAAVVVQNPPHAEDTWQKARVKWRRAIRLLQLVPPDSSNAAQAKERLAVYRTNYAAISDRLTAEQTAREKLKTAQTLAWQAAVTVQNPPHPLRVWQRAGQKWQAAIATLNPIPGTTVFNQSQTKLTTYRSNLKAIDQRVEVEAQALRTLNQFSQTATFLNNLPMSLLSTVGGEQIGVTYEQYTHLVQKLEGALSEFASLPTARQHPVYPQLSEAIADYRYALQLWQAYHRFKQANAQWLYGDSFNLMFPVSPAEQTRLVKTYQVKIFEHDKNPNDKKISLRFSVWAIWQKASDHVRQAQDDLKK